MHLIKSRWTPQHPMVTPHLPIFYDMNMAMFCVSQIWPPFSWRFGQASQDETITTTELTCWKVGHGIFCWSLLESPFFFHWEHDHKPSGIFFWGRDFETMSMKWQSKMIRLAFFFFGLNLAQGYHLISPSHGQGLKKNNGNWGYPAIPKKIDTCFQDAIDMYRWWWCFLNIF